MKYARHATNLAVTMLIGDGLLLYCGGSYKYVLIMDLAILPFVAFAVALSIGLKG